MAKANPAIESIAAREILIATKFGGALMGPPRTLWGDAWRRFRKHKLAMLGAAEGYLTTSLRITAPDSAVVAWGRELDERRYSAAMRQAGALTGETLWHFPMPQHLERSDKKTLSSSSMADVTSPSSPTVWVRR